MVARAQTRSDVRRARLAEALREADVPGAGEDHHWIASRLDRCLADIDPAGARPELEPLVLSGFLLGLGLDPGGCPRLEGACFPEAWLRAVPPLLKAGFPGETWALVQAGVLRYEGGSRWRIDGRRLAPLLADWHELGETLVFRNLARALAPLAREADGGLEAALAGVDRTTGRRWARELREALGAVAPGARSHLFAR